MTRSPPNLHTMVPTWAYIQGMLKVKVKVMHTIVPIRARIQDVLKVNVKIKGHVIRTLL